MVQSRIKMLEKLPVLEPVVIEPGVTLKFPEVRLNDGISPTQNEYKITDIRLKSCLGQS